MLDEHLCREIKYFFNTGHSVVFEIKNKIKQNICTLLCSIEYIYIFFFILLLKIKSLKEFGVLTSVEVSTVIFFRCKAIHSRGWLPESRRYLLLQSKGINQDIRWRFYRNVRDHTN